SVLDRSAPGFVVQQSDDIIRPRAARLIRRGTRPVYQNHDGPAGRNKFYNEVAHPCMRNVQAHVHILDAPTVPDGDRADRRSTGTVNTIPYTIWNGHGWCISIGECRR